MNYKLIYDLLMQKAIIENNLDNIYYERHHIVPRCLGGTNDISNIAKLTPEQHYVAHQLLVKIYPNNYELIYACSMMCMGKIGNKLGSRSNNKLYGWLRNKVSTHMKVLQRNRFAVLRGFIDYDNQTEVIWNNFINDKLSTSEISSKFGISLGTIRSSLKYHADKFNLHDAMIKTRYANKSINSTNTRKNFTPEQEEKRLAACANVDWKSVQGKQGKLKLGNNNPSAVNVMIDGVEYGTIGDAAKALGIEYWTCRTRINSVNYPNYIRISKDTK
jgi:hypothetical protein